MILRTSPSRGGEPTLAESMRMKSPGFVARFAVVLLAVARFAVVLLAVARFAVVLLAVARFAVVLLAVARLAVVFLAVARFAVVFLAVARFAVVFLAVGILPPLGARAADCLQGTRPYATRWRRRRCRATGTVSFWH